MSKLIEYLKLLPLGLKNPKQVVEGIWNEINLENLPEDEKEEIARRRVLCAGCPLMSKNVEAILNMKFDRIEDFCTLCSCPIKTKAASLSSNCGALGYNEGHPENPQEVRWLSYDKKQKG